MKEILSECIDETIEWHKLTIEILSKPEGMEAVEKGKVHIAT